MIRDLTWRRVGGRQILHLLEPRFKKISYELGLAYVEPTLSEEFVKLFDEDQYVEIERRYVEFAKRCNIKLGDSII